MKYCIVLTNTSSKNNAKKIAGTLVEKRLVACVNIVPKITSIYRWKDEVMEDEEYMLVCKTTTENFDKVKEKILKKHDYELPEIIAIPIERGLDEFLSWINKETI